MPEDYSEFYAARDAAIVNSGLTGSDQDYGVGAMKVGANGGSLTDYIYPSSVENGVSYMYQEGCDFGQNPDRPKPPPPPPPSLIEEL